MCLCCGCMILQCLVRLFIFLFSQLCLFFRSPGCLFFSCFVFLTVYCFVLPAVYFIQLFCFPFCLLFRSRSCLSYHFLLGPRRARVLKPRCQFLNWRDFLLWLESSVSVFGTASSSANVMSTGGRRVSQGCQGGHQSSCNAHHCHHHHHLGHCHRHHIRHRGNHGHHGPPVIM